MGVENGSRWTVWDGRGEGVAAGEAFGTPCFRGRVKNFWKPECGGQERRLLIVRGAARTEVELGGIDDVETGMTARVGQNIRMVAKLLTAERVVSRLRYIAAMHALEPLHPTRYRFIRPGGVACDPQWCRRRISAGREERSRI